MLFSEHKKSPKLASSQGVKAAIVSLSTALLVSCAQDVPDRYMACSSSETNKAETAARRAGDKIVDKFIGGNDIRVEVTACEYNKYRKRFKTEISVDWRGLLNRSNEYSVAGTLSFDYDGTDAQFSQTYASQSVKSFDFWMNTMAVGVVVLGTLANN